MKLTRMLGFALVAALIGTAAYAQKNPIVGGKEMFPSKNIIENAVNSADHTTLVAAVKAAGLVDTLQGAGPFTVFAPTNDAFGALPKATLDEALGDPKGLLIYHVVDGKLSLDRLAGTHKTLQGGSLEVTGSGEDFKVNGAPAWSAATCRRPTPRSTSSTRCSCPGADQYARTPLAYLDPAAAKVPGAAIRRYARAAAHGCRSTAPSPSRGARRPAAAPALVNGWTRTTTTRSTPPKPI
jgi:hypothetical protein